MKRKRTWPVVLMLLAAGALTWGQAAVPDPPVDDAAASSQPTATPEPTSIAIESTEETPSAERLVHILPIRSPHGIDGITVRRLERTVTDAVDAGTEVIVFDLDTPGGAVGAAIDICKLIKKQDVETVAWVNSEAISAGAMISVACDRIVMTPRSKIGDCAPIMIGPEGLQTLGETERAKIDSYILAEFTESARLNNYPQVLCEAMVTLGPAIYQISHTTTNEVKYVYADELNRYGLSEDVSLVEEAKSDEAKSDEGDQAEAQSKPAKGAWKLGERVLRARKLLTMDREQAVRYGFAAAVVADEAELAEYLGTSVGQVKRIVPTWSEHLAKLLTHPAVRGLLIIVFLMGLYAEMQAPGIGLPGTVAVIALIIMVGAPYVAGLASWGEILMIVIGLVLLVVEIFVLPGFGVPGIMGLMLLFAGLVLTFAPSEPGRSPGLPGLPGLPQLPQTWTALGHGFLTVFISMCVAVAGFYFLSKYFGTIPVLNRLILTGASGDGAEKVKPVSVQTPGYAAPLVSVGAEGVVVTGLRPVGRAEFNNQIVDVVTEGDWIEVGAAVRVRQVQGNRIVIEEV